MVDNTIVIDESNAPSENQLENVPKYDGMYDASNADSDATHRRLNKEARDRETYDELYPYLSGMMGGEDLEAKATEINRRYGGIQFDDRNRLGTMEIARSSDLGVRFGNLERQIFQLVSDKRQNDYNRAVSEARNKINFASSWLSANLQVQYEKNLREYYMGERDPNDPKKLKFPEKPSVYNIDDVNKYMQNVKQNVFAEVTKGLKWDVVEAVQKTFDTDFQRFGQQATTQLANHEKRSAKESYDVYGKQLVEKAKSNPGARLQDLTDEYTQTVATGINTNVLNPQEGISKIQEISAQVKKEKLNQLKQAISPQENVSPDQAAQKYQMLIKDSIEQGVITPQEGENLYAASISQSISAHSSKALDAIKQKSMDASNTKAVAAALDFKTTTTIEAIKRGITPNPNTIKEIYEGAPAPIKEKLDDELSKAYSIGKFSALPTDIRDEMMANPDLLSNVFYLKSEDDFKMLQEQHDMLKESAEKDPVGHVIAQKLITDIVPVDYSNSDGLVTSLANRAVLSQKVYAQTGVRNSGLTNDETEELGKQYAHAPVQRKAQIAASIYEAYGPDSEVILKKLDEKGYKNLALVGNYFMRDNKSAGVDLLNGMELAKEHENILPTDIQMNNAIQALDIPFPTFADDVAIAGTTPTSSAKMKLLESAKYIYAANLAKEGKLSSRGLKDDKGNTVTDFNQDLYAKSLKQAMNGYIKVGKSVIEGPKFGVTQKQFDTYIQSITPEMVANVPQLQAAIAADKDPSISDRLSKITDGRSTLTKVLQDETVWISRGDGSYNVGHYVNLKNKQGYYTGEKVFQPYTDSNTADKNNPKGRALVVNPLKMIEGDKYQSYNGVPRITPQYNDLLSNLTASEASTRGFSELRKTRLEEPEQPPEGEDTFFGSESLKDGFFGNPPQEQPATPKESARVEKAKAVDAKEQQRAQEKAARKAAKDDKKRGR